MDDVTVIPMTNEALQSVTTPYVAFEHPFPERPSRFERQLEAFSKSMAFVVLTDTWPDAMYDVMSTRATCRAVRDFGKPIDVFSRAIWPETAIYKTSVAKLYEIDERVQYRRQVHFLGQVRDQITGHWQYECSVSPEAAIVVRDRGVFDIDPPPAVALQPESVRVTGIMLLDHVSKLYTDAIQSWQLQTETSKELIVVLCGADPSSVRDALNAADVVIEQPDAPCGAAFNAALARARGTYVAVISPAAVQVRDRIEQQLALDVDVSTVTGDLNTVSMLHMHSDKSGVPNTHESSLVFHRRVFERTGGMQPELPAGFVYDKYLRAQADHELSFGVIPRQVVGYMETTFPYGKSYTQHVHNDVFRRRMIDGGEYNAWSILVRR